MDLALSNDTGDLDLSDGDLYILSGVDAVAQFLSQRLRFFLAEWFLDESKGIPYYDKIFVKNPNPVVVDSILKTEVIQSPGVQELVSFNLDLDFITRRLALDLEAISESGEPIIFSDVVGG